MVLLKRNDRGGETVNWKEMRRLIQGKLAEMGFIVFGGYDEIREPEFFTVKALRFKINPDPMRRFSTEQKNVLASTWWLCGIFLCIAFVILVAFAVLCCDCCSWSCVSNSVSICHESMKKCIKKAYDGILNILCVCTVRKCEVDCDSDDGLRTSYDGRKWVKRSGSKSATYAERDSRMRSRRKTSSMREGGLRTL